MQKVVIRSILFVCIVVKDLYVSYIKQILSGFNSWNGRNIITR